MRSYFNLKNKYFNSLQRAIVYVLIGIFLLDVMGIIIKSMDNKYSVMQYAVARNFFGLFPIFIIGFGIVFVYSAILVPNPPANMTTFIYFFF